MTQHDKLQTISIAASSLLPGEPLERCVLRVVEGPDEGQTFELAPGHLTLGTDERCDYVLSDPTISRAHAEIALLPEGVRLRDLGSTNGITVLSSRVRDALIQPGTLFRLGRTTLGVFPPGPPATSLSERSAYGQLIGQSEAMRRVFGLLERVETTRATVLITGETGTGKSSVAEALHERSARPGPFVTCDCSAIAPGLIGSELFGHRKGAFTGAQSDRMGALEAAHDGTLFLDEIGELPLEMQPALLRFVETNELKRLGEQRVRKVETRVIAATSRNLEAEVQRGAFRVDLYYRLSVIQIRMPSLRQRPEDILPLARHFLREAGRDDLASDLPAQICALMQSYPWPGNTRQLRNATMRLATLGVLWEEERELPDQGSSPSDYHDAKGRLINLFERIYLEQLLRDHRGNLSAASRASGLVRHHLRDLLKKHGLDAGLYR